MKKAKLIMFLLPVLLAWLGLAQADNRPPLCFDYRGVISQGYSVLVTSQSGFGLLSLNQYNKNKQACLTSVQMANTEVCPDPTAPCHISVYTQDPQGDLSGVGDIYIDRSTNTIQSINAMPGFFNIIKVDLSHTQLCEVC